MSSTRLTGTSFAVLGLLERFAPATPYQLKQIARESILHFWTIPHTQLYSECSRLAAAGLLAEEREQGGRRRRSYRLSPSGRRALERWRGDPGAELYELRDPSVLKLFFGADPVAMAPLQLERHQRRLAGYEAMRAAIEEGGGADRGIGLSLESGIGHEREYIRFWRRLMDG